jgi:hypothetical protein
MSSWPDLNTNYKRISPLDSAIITITATERDVGVDIMQPWMGAVDTSASVQRSIFLGGPKSKGRSPPTLVFVTLSV